jgi:hypothetical protein
MHVWGMVEAVRCCCDLDRGQKGEYMLRTNLLIKCVHGNEDINYEDVFEWQSNESRWN